MLLEAYVEAADDPGIYALIDFYAAYRALVRAKIDCFRLADADEEEKTAVIDDIRRYMDQACRYAILFSRPTLWVFSGLPGSGKSFLATHVAAEILAPTLASDEIRKEKAPAPSENAADFGKGDYSAERRQRVYAKMLSRAHDRLKSGRSVILDATFSHARWRKEALRLARDTDANFVFADCACDPDILRARLKKRESSPGLSDARIQHLDEMTADFEPVQEIAPDMHIRIDTGQPIRTALARTMAAGHAGVCAQVRKRWAAL
jgi:predicted kinase